MAEMVRAPSTVRQVDEKIALSWAPSLDRRRDQHGPQIATQPRDEVIDGPHRDHDAIVTQLRELDSNDIRTADLANNVLSSMTSYHYAHGADIRAWRERTGF